MFLPPTVTNTSDDLGMTPRTTVIDWLLDSDPSVRWQVMRDLTDTPAEDVTAERARVSTEGWGARLLALQRADGPWGGDASSPEWWNVLNTLMRLRDLGLDPAGEEARRVVGVVRDDVRWQGYLPQDAAWHGRPFFSGEVEPCINGRVVSIGSYFGQDVREIVDRLLGEQMEDGGWNCEQESGSTRGSFNSTICVLEGLLEHDLATGGSAEVTAALNRGHEYLLTRRLFRRLSTGAVVDPNFTRFSFPTCYHYGVLRGLDHLRAAGVVPEERMAEAIAIVESKRDAEGRWPLEHVHEGSVLPQMDEDEGRPSRWVTLRALRVLRWHEEGRQAPASIGSSTTTAVSDGRSRA